MGCHDNIRHDRFPKQGTHLGCNVSVAFHYDLAHPTAGTVVRDDAEEPFITVIRLSDGKLVLGTECQYTLERL